MAANPQTTSGTGGAVPAYALPEFQQFSGAPAGVGTDASYMAAEAQLRNEISNQYATLLGQLGYIDPATGQFLPGSVQQGADLQEAQIKQNQGQAELGVDQNAQNQGIMFSGIRGNQRAQADLPFQQQLGGIEFQTPLQLADLYRQASGLMGDYNTRNATLLADAAGRRTAAIDAQPAAVTPAPAPTPAPAAAPAPTAATGPAAVSADPTTHSTYIPSTQTETTPRGYARGGEIEEPTNAVVGENATPADPLSHEVIIPRRGLMPHENMILSALQHAAHMRLGRHHTPGPEQPSGDTSALLAPSPGGQITDALSALPGPARLAPALVAAGQRDAGAALWERRHPAAMRAGHIPGYVEAALTERLHRMGPDQPLHIHLPAPPPASLEMPPPMNRIPEEPA